MDRCRDRNLDRERIRTDPCGSRARLRTELDPPAHVAWQGVGWHAARGRQNAIRFELEPTSGGTMVRFWDQLPRELSDEDVARRNFNWGYYLV